ncbi:MAG: hypothetical protein OXT03_04770 [Alphaproteobacteria bacterium]|nr:hypothetical protein [Alphaproteobacteria bacterium]
MFGVLYEKSYQWYEVKWHSVPCFLAATALLYMVFAMTPAMTPAIAQPNFTAMPQADNVAYMQQAIPQGRVSDFITQFETMPFLMLRAAPVAQVASVKQAAPAAQVAPAPQTQPVLQTQATLPTTTDRPATQKRIYQFFHALFDLLTLPKSAPAPIKPDTALGVRG